MIKRLFYLPAFLFLIQHASVAQGDYHFGFQASPSFSWMTTDNQKINGNGSLLGLKLGVLVERRFSDNYAFTTGIGLQFNTGGKLLFDQPGNFWSNSAADATIPYTSKDTFQMGTELKYNLRYFEIPLGLRMRTQEFGFFRYYVEPAFYLGFRTDAKGTIRNSPRFDQEKISISNDVSVFNIAWGIGGGVEYTVANNTAIIAGLYYQQGFAGVQKDGNTIYTTAGAKPDASRATINAITIRLGVMF